MAAAELREPAERLGKCQRIEQVVLHPLAQRDMPAPPEIGQADRKIGAAEILLHGDAKQAGDAHHQVDAAGKVAVKLDAVECRTQKADDAGVGRVTAVDLRHDRCKRICDHRLFQHAVEHAQKPVLDIIPGKIVSRRELRLQIGKAVDWALHQLREIADKQRIAQEAPLCPMFAAADIDQISGGLENVEGYAERQKKMRQRQRRWTLLA